jgi:hypothetical protein
MRIKYMNWTQSPVSCRLMNVKVHQTLVWLNLLSCGTRDSPAPTIGIQSDAVGEVKTKAGLSAETVWRGVRDYIKVLLML